MARYRVPRLGSFTSGDAFFTPATCPGSALWPGAQPCLHHRGNLVRQPVPMTDTFDHAPQVWNAAQLRDALKDLPDDTPIHIGVAEDPGDFDGYRESVLVDAHHVENWWPATGTTPERAETEKAITLFADWTPGEYDFLD